MSASSRLRFKRELKDETTFFLERLDSSIWDWAERTNSPLHNVASMAWSVLQGHDRLARHILGGRVEEKQEQLGGSSIGKSFRDLWGFLSSPQIVSTNQGWQFRRLLLCSICGLDTTYADAKNLVGGQLSRESFEDAQSRRELFSARQDTRCL